ncbi:MAG: acyltransferase family protein, partial [Chitinophagaceae bacterium]
MQPASRQAHLDWLRIFAIIGVLFFHAAMPFVAEESWHIKNKETSNVLLEFNFWLSRFRMPLLFFISGAVSYYMMQKRTAGSFIGLRFRRLFIPLLFGMLVIIPPQIYMERVAQGFTGSFWDFYPNIFNGQPYPKGDTSWHHLWFIAYLFVYDLVAAPLFAWMMSKKGQAFTQGLGWLAKGKRIYLFIIPAMIAYASLVLKFPQTNDLVHDYTYLIYWFLFLLIGFFCASNPLLMDSLERNRRTSLSIGLALFIAMNYLRWNSLEPWDASPDTWKTLPGTYVYLAMFPAIAWFWVMALTGYGKKYLRKPTAFSNYASQAVYPFFIVHQTIIVILAFYVVQASDSVLSKYLFLSLASLFLSVAVYHLVIRRWKVTRFLFGMKPNNSSKLEV